MKEIIVICGTIMLGCFIFGRIYGFEDTISAERAYALWK